MGVIGVGLLLLTLPSKCGSTVLSRPGWLSACHFLTPMLGHVRRQRPSRGSPSGQEMVRGAGFTHGSALEGELCPKSGVLPQGSMQRSVRKERWGGGASDHFPRAKLPGSINLENGSAQQTSHFFCPACVQSMYLHSLL